VRVDQRLALRFPPLAAASARLFGKLPPSSRTRQALLSRTVRLNAEAFNRRDFNALLLSYHPQAEFRAPRPLAESGILQTSYRGYDGYVEFFREWLSAWGDCRMRPSEVIDPRRPSRDRRRDRRSRRDQRRTGDRSTLRCRVHAARGPARFRLRRGVWGPEGRCGIVLLGAAVRRV